MSFNKSVDRYKDYIIEVPDFPIKGVSFKDIKAYDSAGKKIRQPWAGPWESIKTVESDEDFWSRVKGKHFQLAEKKKTSQPRSWLEAMKKSKSGYEW